jgi:hypothetical protein
LQVHLLSDSCTTGWAHWGHGELWLTPHSIVRIGQPSRTLRAATRGALSGIAGGVAGAVALEVARSGREVTALEVDSAEWDGYLADHRSVLRVDLGDVVEAALRAGIITSRLRLRMRDGRNLKLLWMRNTVAVTLLERALWPPAT